ncbi:hypothetical protein C8F01DRAFT_462690 [Mycena amicta]|nr:hypothetical protein C8F01DRAFT_462690 [Mycena amicta]
MQARSRLQHLASCTSVIADALERISEPLTQNPFLGPIARTLRAISGTICDVKQNKNDCIELVDGLFVVLLEIVALHTKAAGTDSDSADISPTVLHHIGDFTMTLVKIQAYLERQQDRKRVDLKGLFRRQGGLTALLNECRSGLQRATEVFKINSATILNEVRQLAAETEEMHQTILRIIDSLLNDAASFETTSTLNESRSSSLSLSMLPPSPSIFHGRDTQVDEILKSFVDTVPRIAILGTGGIGKTSLALRILHDPYIVARYSERRFFIPCEAATTKDELIRLVATHFELPTSQNQASNVVHHLTKIGPCVFVLDNLETCWEAPETRQGVESFLSLLTDIESLALMITLRGSERPTNVRWTRPFLAPLTPVDLGAAQQIFLDIADTAGDSDSAEIRKILSLTDNMPLTIHLMAHVVDSEGPAAAISRWELERTSMPSDGQTKRTNLDLSISLSLSSPRLTATPSARDLLSLLSLLPMGLEDSELIEITSAIPHILACKESLLRTSLAYMDNQRLKSLVPIREYMRKHHPPRAETVNPVFTVYKNLFGFMAEGDWTLNSKPIVNRLRASFMNVQNILAFKLALPEDDPDDRAATLYCGLSVNKFNRLSGQGVMPLFAQMAMQLPRPVNHTLEVRFIAERLIEHTYSRIVNPLPLIEEAEGHLPFIHDIDTKCGLFNAIGDWYQRDSSLTKAQTFYRRAIQLCPQPGASGFEAYAWCRLAIIEWRRGKYHQAFYLSGRAQEAAIIRSNLSTQAQALWVQGLCLNELGDYSRSIAGCWHGRTLLGLSGLEHGHLDGLLLEALQEAYRLNRSTPRHVRCWNSWRNTHQWRKAPSMWHSFT